MTICLIVVDSRHPDHTAGGTPQPTMLQHKCASLAAAQEWRLVQALFRRSQLKAMLDIHGIDYGLGGDLSEDEITVIRGALDLSHKTATSCMTPLDKVSCSSTPRLGIDLSKLPFSRHEVDCKISSATSIGCKSTSKKLCSRRVLDCRNAKSKIGLLVRFGTKGKGCAGVHAQRGCCGGRSSPAGHLGVGAQQSACAQARQQVCTLPECQRAATCSLGPRHTL